MGGIALPRRILTLWLAVIGTPAGAIPPLVSEPELDHVHYSHKTVRITSTGLQPEVMRIHTDDAFGWLNFSSRVARVSFDAKVGKRLLCTSLTTFRITGDRLESGDVEKLHFVSLCRLLPGQYDYRVRLLPGRRRGEELLEGTLVVE